MTVIDDIISHLDTNWNVGVVAKPGFIDGHKVIAEIRGANYIQIFNSGEDYEDVDCSGVYRDEYYSTLLFVGSRSTKAIRDLLMSEVNRICNIILTGYSYNKITGKLDLDESKLWQTNIIFELIKFMETK